MDTVSYTRTSTLADFVWSQTKNGDEFERIIDAVYSLLRSLNIVCCCVDKSSNYPPRQASVNDLMEVEDIVTGGVPINSHVVGGRWLIDKLFDMGTLYQANDRPTDYIPEDFYA